MAIATATVLWHRLPAANCWTACFSMSCCQHTCQSCQRHHKQQTTDSTSCSHYYCQRANCYCHAGLSCGYRYQALVDTLNHITAEEANLLWLTPYGCSLVVADPAQPPRAKICDYCSCLLPDKPGCSRAVACGTCAVACYCSVGCMEQDKLSHGRMCLRLQRLKHTTQWWRLSRHDHIDQEFGSHIKAWYHDATVSQADTGSGID